MKNRFRIGKPAQIDNVEKRLGTVDIIGEGSMTLVCDSQDRQQLCEYIAGEATPRYNALMSRFSSFFVVAENGDYTHVYGCEWSVPPCDATVYRITF